MYGFKSKTRFGILAKTPQRVIVELLLGRRSILSPFTIVGTPGGNTVGDRTGLPIFGHDPVCANTGTWYPGKLEKRIFGHDLLCDPQVYATTNDDDNDGKGSYSLPSLFRHHLFVL